jgi:hypothetical protein
MVHTSPSIEDLYQRIEGRVFIECVQIEPDLTGLLRNSSFVFRGLFEWWMCALVELQISMQTEIQIQNTEGDGDKMVMEGGLWGKAEVWRSQRRALR